MSAASSLRSASPEVLDAAVRRVPITGGVEHVSAPEGSTIAEFVAIAFPIAAHRPFIVASIDGEEVAPDAWDRVPRAGEHVALAFRPGGKDFLRVILTIAVIAVSVWVGAGGLGVWFAAGTWQAAVAAAGVSILGNLAINALIPLPKPGTIEAPPPYYSLSTARNSSRPWGVVPMLFGTHRIAAPRMSEPFQEVLGGVTYLRVALCLGMCPMSVTDWKIGETALSAFSGVEMEVRLNEDDPAHTLITGDPTQEAVGATLSHTEWTERTTTTDVDEIEVIYDFPSGLGGIDSKGRKTARTVNLRLQYRPTGSSEDWSDWRPTVPQANTASAGAGAPFRPDYFTLEADLVAWRGQLGGMGGVASDIVPITRSDPGRAFRHSERFAVPRGQYDVRTQRAEAVSTDPNVSDAVSWGILGSIRSQADPFPNRKLATACFRIKATDQLSNMVDTLNCLASSLQPVFSYDALEDPTIASAAEFTDVEASSNPAVLALLAARGPNTAYPKPDAEIDWPAWASAAAKATARGLTFNEYVETSIGRWEMVRRILAAMHARPVKHNGKLSVVVDDSKAGQAPAQVFSPRNVRNFRWQKTYPRLPHAIRTPFANAANGWQADEVTVYMPGFTAENATRYETVAMPGKTDADEIRTVVNQYARNGHFQTETFEFETDAEHLTVKRGDYCVVQHFAMATGLGAARIRTRELNGSGDVTAIILDRPVETPVGEALAVQWRTIVADSGLARMEVLGEQAVTRDAANPKRFVFTTPQTGETKPAASGADYEGDIALVGLAGKVSFEVLVRDIAPRPHLQAAISCVAYAGERFVDAPDWPAHDPKVTRPYAPRPSAPTDAVPIASTLQIAVGFTQPPMPTGVELTGYRVARRESGSAGDSWEPLGALGRDERIAIVPAGEPGADYDIRIIAVGLRDDGVTVYSDALVASAVGAVTAPAAPSGCGGAFTTRTSSGGAQQLVLTATWTANENPDVLDTVVEQRVSTGPDVWQEIGRGAASTGRTEIHGLPVGRAYLLRFINVSKRGAPSTPTAISSITAPDTLVATGAIAPAPGGALDDALDDIDTALAAASSAIDAAEARLDAAEADISDANDRLDDAETTLGLHGTDIGSLETVTAGQATLITGLQAVTNVQANLLPNGGFARNAEGWTLAAGAVVGSNVWGVWIGHPTDTSLHVSYSDLFDLSPGVYTLSGDMVNFDTGANTSIDVICYASNGTDILLDGGNAVADVGQDFGGARKSVTFTAPSGTAKARVRCISLGVSPTAIAFRRLKLEYGSVATLWTDEQTDRNNSARITTVETVNSDQDSAIATLDSRLDAAETDIDGVETTASNLSTRMAAVDGGSASATSIEQLKAAYGFGFNECTDSEFLDIDEVWQNLYSASGSQTYFGTFEANQRRYLARTMSGMTVGHQFNIGQFPDFGLQVEAGDRVEASMYFGVSNTGRISSAICYVDWYDNDGNYLTSNGAAAGSSPYNRIGGFLTAPSGARRATLTAGFIAAHAEPDAHIQGPVLRKCSPQQTALSPYTRSGDPSTLARVGGAEASITEVESVNADQDSAIASIDSRLDVAETDVDGLESTASNHTTRLAAIDGGSTTATSIAQLVAKTDVFQNMIPNSTGADGMTKWNNPGAWVAGVYPAFGAWFSRSTTGVSGLTEYFLSDPIPAIPSVQHMLSLAPYVAGRTAGDVQFFVAYYDAGGSFITAGGHIVLSADDPNLVRRSSTFTPHASTATIRFGVYINGFSGNGGFSLVGFAQAKIERGSYATIWSDDAMARNNSARITTVESVNSDQDSAIAVIDSRMDAAETDIDGVESTASNLSTRMAAVDGGSTSAFTLDQVRASQLARGDCVHDEFRDSTFWNLPVSGVSLNDLDGGWRFRRCITFANGTYDLFSDMFPVEPGATYRIRCRIWNNAGSWSGYFHPLIHMPNVAWYSLKHGTGVDPGTHDATHGIVAAADTGNLEWIFTNPTGISGNANREWQFRFLGSFTGGPVVITCEIVRLDQYAQVTTNTEAIDDEISTRAAFQTAAEAEFDDINATVSTQGGAIADIEGGTAWLESVVAAGGGDLGAMRMRAGKAGSFLDLIFTVIRLANVSNGSVLEVMRAVGGFAFFSNPVSIDVGGKRMTLGPGFGVSSDLLFWFGPDTTAISAMTKTNGHWAWATDGETYRGAATLTTPTVDDQTKTGTADFNNVTTSGTTVHTLAFIDLTVGASGYLELLSPLFFGPLSINAETGMTLSAGSDWFGQMIITEQLQSGGTEHTLWTMPLQISDTGGGLFDFLFDAPANRVVAQNVSGPSRYRIKLQRTSGSNNVSGNGLQGRFTIRRTP